MTTTRRSMLKFLAAAAVTAGAALWGLLPEGARAAIAARFPTRTVEKNTFRFDPARGEVVWKDGRREAYRLTLDGLVETPAQLSYAQLRALPQVRRTADFHCVEGWSVEAAPWGGVDFRELFARVRVQPQARYAVFHSLGQTDPAGGLTHYVESLPLADLLNPAMGALLALDLEGAPLTDARGAPARVISPFDLAYKSSKFVTRVEFSAQAVPGWWTRANPIYPVHAPVQKSRLRSPDPRSS
ncbi:MAG TPA: molybdopterin-dependent oxidoreductase [Humidesulfovibrio sp.]|uniref:molybdopterin-dependent oxidoreductase n=1 Tax=Humidesulfovibrio sp. TaxID=2910988 RepID=UPI002C589F9B|nr:molybdopterin-dependent oxidoreductase [Humidesulfovibrio sp.]HWR04324.1 molybdopterin-dependent oxidoreductase [Humidesulfovibrio sp.]